MQYRAEIDGLRAVAVIPVILFHAGFELFSGGFVGVDVFFVISGYLITSIILTEKERGTFSLLHFYERRARRILPALFLVMLVSLPFAWYWLLPSDLKNFSQSLIAVSTFSSNILFLMETGYWGVENEMKPLLHTWTLAVEEQYYIVFPLLLLAMWRYGKNWIFASLMFITFASLLLSQWGASNFPSANFFLLPTRAWELAIGAIIAFYSLNFKCSFVNQSSKFSSTVFSLLGLFLVGYAVFVFDEATPFPSVYSVVPTLGAGLIILFASADNLTGKILGSRGLVAIGLVSYSAYLWHQPVFAFVRHRSLDTPSSEIFILLTLFSFLLAFVTWQFVEKPFRHKERYSASQIIKFSLIGSTFFVLVGLAGHITNGFDDLSIRNKMSYEEVLQNFRANYGLSNECQHNFTLTEKCRTSDEPEIVVWGDSFAMHLVRGVLASNPDVRLIQFTKSACGPFFDISPVTANYPEKWAHGCLEFTQRVRQWIRRSDTTKVVVVSSPFDQYLSPEHQLLTREGKLRKTDKNFVLREFVKTLNELKGMGVTPVVVSPPAANGQDIGRCLSVASWNELSLDKCNFGVADMSPGRLEVYDLLNQINGDFKIVRLDRLTCDKEICKTHFGLTWLYRDEGHFSYSGSAELGRRFDLYNLILNSSSNGQPKAD